MLRPATLFVKSDERAPGPHLGRGTKADSWNLGMHSLAVRRRESEIRRRLGIRMTQLGNDALKLRSCPVKWLRFVTAILAPYAIAASSSLGSSPPSSSSTLAMDPMLK